MERRRVGVAGVRASEDEGAAGGPHFAPAMPDAGGQASGRATAAAACGRPHLAVMASTGVAVEYASGVSSKSLRFSNIPGFPPRLTGMVQHPSPYRWRLNVLAGITP
jgi:hypothetical protein